MTGHMKSKTVQFLNSLLTETSDFRLHVLESLERVFGFEHSIFWEIDDSGNFAKPVFLNVEDNFMEDYQSSYYQEDVLNPHKVKERIPHNSVLTVKDVMPLEDYENTVYYDGLMRQHNYYHEILIYLTRNTHLIGAIGLGMREDENLNIKDIKRLEVISKHISSALYAKRLLNNTKYQNLVMEITSSQLPVGIVFFDEFFNILHINHTAQDIFLDITPQTYIKDAQEYLGSLLSRNYPSWRLGLVDTFYTKNFGQIYFHLIPKRIKDNTVYSLYLVPQNLLLKQSITRDPNPYDLSKRELEIVELVMKGHTNQDIASELFISIHTVKTHLQNIFKKVGVSNRTSLCLKLTTSESEHLLDKTS